MLDMFYNETIASGEEELIKLSGRSKNSKNINGNIPKNNEILTIHLTYTAIPTWKTLKLKFIFCYNFSELYDCYERAQSYTRSIYMW